MVMLDFAIFFSKVTYFFRIAIRFVIFFVLGRYMVRCMKRKSPPASFISGDAISSLMRAE